jgi:hypothetical protein
MGHTVTVYEPNIARLFSKARDVGKFGDRFANKAVRLAKTYTPNKLPPDPRPGKSENLRERNRHRGYLRAGQYLGQVVMENTASYARYAWRRGPASAEGADPRNRLQIPRVHMRMYSAISSGFGSDKGFVYVRSVGPHYDPRDHWLERAVRDAAKGRI